MPQIVNTFPDGSQVEFGAGRFDSWCVYYKNAAGERTAPKDIQYFANFRRLAKRHGARKIYGDFVSLYEQTGRSVDPGVIGLIKSLALEYREDSLEVEKLFSIVYAGMIAEENKHHAVLGKRIKRLGLHQILVENLSAEYAASFSKGKKAGELRLECERRGFQ